MLNRLEIRFIWLLSAIFIAANSLFIFAEIYWFSVIPIVIALLLATVLSLEKVFWFLVFCTPLSLNLEKLELGGIGMFLPTEPLLFFILILFTVRMFLSFEYDKRIFLHPISLAILFNLVWMVITTFTSERPIVSLKFLIARLWFVVTFFFIAAEIFKKNEKIRTFFWLYIISMTMVIIYTIINHAMHDFGDKPAHFVMRPFFKDHTSYGAILVMYFPILLYILNDTKKMSIRFYTGLVAFIFLLGIVFSYTRAAWLSLLGAFALWMIYKLKIKFQFILATMVLIGTIIFFSWSQIMMTLEENRKESSSDFAEHIQSMSNISSDASNLERINRWESALKMFKERPIFGWGPGTYMFEYAPFQHSQSLTIISTNAGRLGNAHSEYIGPLAESGILGSLSFITIIVIVFIRGSALYHRLPKGNEKALILAVLMGFSTYVMHGFLNNYLDTDKASLPFWGFIAILVAIDLKYASFKSDSEQR